eukprot:6197306-Pleurochrysis_carterae.AAC.1
MQRRPSKPVSIYSNTSEFRLRGRANGGVRVNYSLRKSGVARSTVRRLPRRMRRAPYGLGRASRAGRGSHSRCAASP